jgi:predicted aminopeptidase
MPLLRFVRRAVLALVLRAGWEEGKILWHRRAISAMIADPATAPGVRAKLQVVLAARAFARDSLGLAAKQSFTTYSRLPHDTLVLVLSGAYRDRLQPVTWWFPIVGRVPYKGYFDFAGARAAARQLESKGEDAYLRPSPAFSTLGFFNDPLLSTTLQDDSLELANTVIHELTHNTFYASGQAVFNESFANFVGARGSEQFFRARGDSAVARVARARWHDEKLLGRFWAGVAQALDSVYRAHPDSRAARIAAHDTVYARARDTLVDVFGPQFETIDTSNLHSVRLSNAALLAQQIYVTDLDDFDAVYARERDDLARTVVRIIGLARSRPADPFGAVRDWLSTGSGVAADSAPAPAPAPVGVGPASRGPAASRRLSRSGARTGKASQ